MHENVTSLLQSHMFDLILLRRCIISLQVSV